MQMQEDDKIFKVLGDKLRNYEAGEASDADWAAFQAVYPAKKEKKRAFVWFLFPLMGISLSLLAWFTYNYTFENKKTQLVQNKPNAVLSTPEPKQTTSVEESKTEVISVDSKSESIEISSKKTSTSSKLNTNNLSNSNNRIKATNYNNLKSNVGSQIENKVETNSTINSDQTNINTKAPLVVENKNIITPKKEKNDLTLAIPIVESKKDVEPNPVIEPKPVQGNTVSDLKNQISSNQISKNQEKEIDLSEIKSDVKENNVSGNDSSEKTVSLKQNPVDTTLISQARTKQKLNVNLLMKHIDLNAMLAPGMSIYNQSLDAANLAGMGLGLAFGLNKHWYVGTGLNYMYARTQSKIQKEVPHEYTSISKIDTSLKYDFSSSMIVMNMDTHYQKHVGTKIDELTIVRKSQVLSIPIIFGYSLGNQKTEMSLFGGVQNDWLVEEYTTNNFATKATETFTNQKLLAAPLVGFGFSRKFYANWALNLGMDYRHYLSSSLDKKDYWRVQAGIRYHLK